MDFFEDISVFIFRRRSVQRRVAGEPTPVDKTTLGTARHERQEEDLSKDRELDTSCLSLSFEPSVKQQTKRKKVKKNKKHEREQLRFLYTYYTHICYLKKEALMAFITLDKWGLNLKTKEKCSGKKRSSSCPASGLSFSFPLFFCHLLSANAGHSVVTEVSMPSVKLINLSPQRDQRTKHFYSSTEIYGINNNTNTINYY